jgi:hypothetical protein
VPSALRHWRRAGRPPIELFAADAPATRTGIASCRVPGCGFPAIVGKELCVPCIAMSKPLA